MFQPYGDVFADVLGIIQVITANLAVKEGNQPKSLPHLVLFTIKGTTEADIGCLEQAST